MAMTCTVLCSNHLHLGPKTEHLNQHLLLFKMTLKKLFFFKALFEKNEPKIKIRLIVNVRFRLESIVFFNIFYI